MSKWYKIGPRLLLITNRKLHTGFQMIYKSMTLNGHNSVLNGMFQAISGHISETVRERAKVTTNH